MRYVRLGSSGLKVSEVALGMMSYGDPAKVVWQLPEDRAEPIVRAAVDAGVTFFDTADMYADGVSEEITGRLLGKLFPRRGDYVLASKVYYPMTPDANGRGLSRKHIMDAVDASLRRLGTDHIDLYQIHRWDNTTPIEETMAALHDLVRDGKVRYVGASLMHTWQFAKAQYTAALAGGTRFVSMQTRYNLVDREEEREMIPFCRDQGVGVLPYSPLARGLLARAPRPDAPATPRAAAERDARPISDNDLEVVEALTKVADNRGVSLAQVALAWVRSRPGVSACIVGVTRSGQLADALAATKIELTDDEVTALETPYRPRPLRGYL